jgi:putative acetyltransferase
MQSAQPSTLRVALEPVDQPDVVALIADLDAFQAPLYPAESNHLLDIDSLKQPNVIFVVARDTGGAALACGAVVLFDGYGELKRMYVRPEARGRGIAKTIIGHLERESARRSCHVLRLETGIRQPEALGLYARAGYERRGRYGDYPDDPLSVFMEKRIPPGA